MSRGIKVKYDDDVKSAYDELRPALPKDHCRQTNSRQAVAALLGTGFFPATICDLGCGAGDSFAFFEKLAPHAHWVGVDIESSPEVEKRTQKGPEFRTFDGVNLPFDDESIELIYSNQVLEHVRYPERLLQSVALKLSPNGYFVGSTSHLEPYHSYSYGCFTPWGFKKLCDSVGLQLLKIRPGIDALTLIERSMKHQTEEYAQYFDEESPHNQSIEKQALAEGKSIQIINHRKLSHCGTFSFVCRRERNFVEKFPPASPLQNLSQAIDSFTRSSLSRVRTLWKMARANQPFSAR